jgi:hypothetical protein
MAELDARVVAFDQCANFIERARERTPDGTAYLNWTPTGGVLTPGGRVI